MAERAAGQIGLHFIPAGEPWRNGCIESFNSRIRDGCRNITSFWSLTQARVVIPAGNRTTTTAATLPGATNPRPATLPPVPANERSFAVD